MEVKIQTLTPLWTGGVDGSMDRIHETGIIGSMRWWYEAIVRGLGGSSCDPTSDNKCRYNPKDPSPPEEQLCSVCQVFGATGWRRRFRLGVIDNSKQIFQGNNVLIPSGHIRHTRRGKMAGGWYIGSGKITQDRPASEDTILEFPFTASNVEKEVLIPTLMLIQRWGGLGAKNQLGYGIVGFQERFKNTWKPLSALIPSFNCSSTYTGDLPALNDFFFAKIRFTSENNDWWKKFSEIESALKGQVKGVKLKDPITEQVVGNWLTSGSFPIAPIIRKWLRFTLLSNESSNILNFLLGTSEEICPLCYHKVYPDEKIRGKKFCENCSQSLHADQTIKRAASKLKISSAYRITQSKCWEFRIWGWISKQTPPKLSIKRDNLLQQLYDAIQHGGDLWSGPFVHLHPCAKAVDWHECKWSKRDSVRYKNSAEFLHCLIEGA